MADDKPYRGPLSYEIEDATYFFGRERQAELLLAKILSSRFTLLHAQSGAGKTSLSNAKVIPGLEAQGWTALRVLPRGNPSYTVRIAVLLSLLPPPAAELTAVNRALALLWEPGDDPTIGDILERVDALQAATLTHREPPNARLRQALLPVEDAIEIKAAGVSFKDTLRPLFLRLLRETLEVSQYAEHLTALLPSVPTIGEGTRASELRRILSDPALAAAHTQLLADLYTPSPSLLEFFTNVIVEYGQRRTRFGLVLILDQFEELFTLFTDSIGSSARQLWRLRWEFIENLGTLYEKGAALPIRYVISMRDEYIAHLDPVRRFVRDLDASSFHLTFLERDEARLAIEEPAALFNYGYSPECYQNIFDALLREDRFVEPAPLQIVCERLWRERDQGATLDAASGRRIIPLTSFPQGGTASILDSFFDEVIDSLPTKADRAEALDMLEPLVTAGGTRNIVMRDSLVKAPFRDAVRRQALLDRLVASRIVRIEHRHGGQFVEISHEFLIASVLSSVHHAEGQDQEFGRLRMTLKALDRFKDVDFRADVSRLPSHQLFEEVNGLASRIEWKGSEWAVELMLRSAVWLKAAPVVLREWAERYRQGDPDDAHPMFDDEWFRARGRALLNLDELALLAERDTSRYSAERLEHVLRSQIWRGTAAARPLVVRWTQEWNTVWQRETRS